MVQRFEVSEGQAKVMRRWIMLLSGFALLVMTLNLARIPLTVFAFMGGALAIGVGFGTQTLLRNLISGVIVLFERKVRVGDIVDVEGVQGVVTAVDIRSTTVRQFDGIETMVPNSMLLEQKITNWTGESPTMRRVVKVGVAYGSPTRQVAEILERVAEDHGLVMKDPKPLVIFEDFGDNALVFALYFWVDVVKSSGLQVQSDLRFMLEKRFAEAGITVAFPQRNIHLESGRPLQVEVVPGGTLSARDLMYGEADHEFMSRALALAERALTDAAPNPRVGCVIVRDGRVHRRRLDAAAGLEPRRDRGAARRAPQRPRRARRHRLRHARTLQPPRPHAAVLRRADRGRRRPRGRRGRGPEPAGGRRRSRSCALPASRSSCGLLAQERPS